MVYVIKEVVKNGDQISSTVYLVPAFTEEEAWGLFNSYYSNHFEDVTLEIIANTCSIVSVSQPASELVSTWE